MTEKKIKRHEDGPESFNEALEVLLQMEQVDVRRGYEKVVSPIIRRHRVARRRRIAGFAAAVAIPAACLLVIWLYVGGAVKMDRNADSSVMLVLGDGQQIAVDTLSGKIRLPDRSEAMISRDAETFIYTTEKAASEVQEVSMNTIDVPRGHMFDMILGDGTKVWMNAQTKLHFPSAFSASERRVRLEGEAYFDVAHDPAKPFVVEAGDESFTVLGTEFNIYAYPGEQAILATLVSGSISASKQDRTVVLRPDQQSRWDSERSDFIVAQVDANAVTGWRRGLFVFGDNTLEQVMFKVARWYNLDVVFSDDKLRTIEYKGNLEKYEDFRTILDIIENTSPVRFRTKGDTVTVSSR